MSRRFLVAFLTLVTILGVGLPAVADDLVADSDVLTAGTQTTLNLSATPGQTMSVPVDVYVVCKTQKHIGGNVTVNLAPSGGNGSSIPAGGSLSAAAVTVIRPAGWPTDGNLCPTAELVTAAARMNLQVGAPTPTGSYVYKARWTTSDNDAMGGTGDGEVTINVTVAPAAPTDTTPPVITKIVSGTPGSNGWHTSNVTVTWSVTDAQSAVVIDSGCGVQNFVNETAAATASCQAHSAGGSASDSVSLKIDKTGPSAMLSPAGTLGQNGWYTSNVTLTATGQDPISGGVTCTALQTQSAETSGATFNATCTNAAGLSSATNSVTVKVDKTGPSATMTPSGTLGTNGWFTDDVTVATSGSDAISGGVVCTNNQTLTTDTSGTEVNGSCTNAAGLATNASPITVKLDKSNPSASLSAVGALGADGWYTSDVTVETSGADNVSDPTACTADQLQDTNTTGTVFNGSCTNDAGRTQAADPLTIKRDASAPTVHLEVVSGTPGTNGWYTSGVTVRTVGADPTSGVTCSTDQVLTDETAGTVVTGFCTNGAGARTDAAPLTVKIDLTGPTALAAVSAGTLGANGWYTSNVTVHTSGSDSISGPVTCDADQHQNTETVGTDFTGTCTNAAGLSTTSAAITVKVDKTGPSASLTPSGTLGLNGWFTSDVTVSTSGQDGISGGVTCTADQHQTSETTGASFDGSCTNAAGLTTNGTPLNVKVDKTGPVATLSVTSGTLGSNGWYTTDVTVHTDGSDDVSGPVTCTADQTLSTDSDGTEVNGSCTNKAGLSTDADPTIVKLDKSDPTANLSVTGTLGANGWYVDDVTVQTSGADNVSDPTTCTPDQIQDTDTAGMDFNGSCTNDAGRTQEASPVTVKRDASPPTAQLVVSGTEGANGWYTSNVAVTVDGQDAISGVTCTGGAVLDSETQGVEVTGSCTNGAGLKTDAEPVFIKIDKTAPSAALAVTAGTAGDNGWYTSNVTISTSGDDSVSGPVTCTADQHQNTETKGQLFGGSCTNGAGLVGNAPGLTVKLDRTAPSTHLSVTAGTGGDNGWYTSDVTVHTDGTDDISDVVSCTADQFQTDETTGQTFSGSCRNEAGLTSGDDLVVKLDKSGPSAALSPSGQVGANGWFVGNVDITTAGGDSISGPVTCTAEQHQTAETVGTTFNGSCTNRAGLTTDASAISVKLDKTAPTATLTPAGTAGANGWYVDDVTVTATGSDTISEPVTCTAAKTLTGDTDGTLVTGSCTNDAGLTENADPVTIKLDKSNPSASLSVSSGTLGSNGWYVDDVTVTTTGSDNVSNPTACTADQYQLVDTTGTEFNGACTNDAGRTQNAAPLTVMRDASPPSAQLEIVSGTAGTNGWYTSAVTVRALGSDDQSDVSCSADVTLTADTTGTQVTGSCTNAAGLTTAAEPVTVKIDKTAPSALLAATGQQGSNGWFTGDVTVSTSGSDSISGPVTCTADQSLTSESTGTTFNGSCTNRAGLSTDAAPLTVKLDKTAPSALLSITGGTTGSNGWYVTNVTVSTSGSDTISGPVDCTAPQTFSSDTTGTDVQGSCTNGAGLTREATQISFKLDKTAPTVTVVNLDPSYAVGSVPTPSCTTTDDTSGVATQATPSVPALTSVGTYVITCGGASDRAGNSASATKTFQSIYRWDGFLQPINDTAHQIDTATSIFKAGSTVPVKFQLKRANGTIITPSSAPIWITPLQGSPTSAAVDETAYVGTATTGGTYRADGDQWIYNWSTKGLKAGYYYRIGVKLDDGQTYYVNIGLR